jgi:hypothetical protein
MLGLNIYQYVSRETLQPKTITRIVYKDKIINNNVYVPKIIYKQTEKQKNDLIILVKIDTRMEKFINQAFDGDYDLYKSRNQKNMTKYEFDLYYLNTMIVD